MILGAPAGPVMSISARKLPPPPPWGHIHTHLTRTFTNRQSWAPTMEKVSDSRQPTPNNRETTTATDTDTRQSTVRTRQLVTNNYQGQLSRH